MESTNLPIQNTSTDNVNTNHSLSLEELNSFESHFLIEDPKIDRKTLIEKLNTYYNKGFGKYAQNKNIFVDLPNKRLWPNKFQSAYKWMEEAYTTLRGTPELIFDEMIRNADTHGNGLIGISAAWKDQNTFIFRIKDQGEGFGTSEIHGDNMGMFLIGNFATEAPKTQTSNKGFVIEICRDLNKVKLPEKSNWGTNFSKKIAFIQAKRLTGERLPALEPNSNISYSYNANIGRFGGLDIINLLGQKIGEEPYDNSGNNNGL